jgi:demethylmenaquinone methyltransferase/2-methoxy-6-polyprenyl-1,4-benzoquinol methylase
MFGRVARRYDLLTHLLSFQADRYWRRCTVRRVRAVLERSDARVMDVCCGTGDLTLALARGAEAHVFGCDFCRPMLEAARRKGAPPLVEADGLRLPLPDASFDLLTVAFGFRNFTNYQRGLREMRRVLKPGGILAMLEFSTPPNPIFRAFYRCYSRQILPRIGGLVSGSADAYRYLPESVRRFPDAPGLAAEMRAAGFRAVEFDLLTFGVVALHLGRA